MASSFFEDVLKFSADHLGDFSSKVNSGLTDFGDKVSLSKGITKLEGNKAINPIEGNKRWLDRGITGVMRGASNGAVDADGNEVNLKFGQAVKNAYTKPNGSLDVGAIAGSYIGGAAGYRMLSGGGAYKDKNGNANLIGIPFV